MRVSKEVKRINHRIAKGKFTYLSKEEFIKFMKKPGAKY